MLRDRTKLKVEYAFSQDSYPGTSLELRKLKHECWGLYIRTHDSSQGSYYEFVCTLSLDEAKDLWKDSRIRYGTGSLEPFIEELS